LELESAKYALLSVNDATFTALKTEEPAVEACVNILQAVFLIKGDRKVSTWHQLTKRVQNGFHREL
jgi:hypothetical protein